MRRTTLALALTLTLLLLAAPAHAGTYQWSLTGWGSFSTFPDYDTAYFSNVPAVLTINYELTDPASWRIDVSIEDGTYETDPAYIASIASWDSGAILAGNYGTGGTITATFDRGAGPLDPSGNPLSLASLLPAGVTVLVTPAYNFNQLHFEGSAPPTLASVPEPSGLLMLSIPLVLTLCGTVLQWRWRTETWPRKNTASRSGWTMT